MEHKHLYVTPDVLPPPDCTDTEWIQRVAMLGEMAEELLRTTHLVLCVNAPMLLGEDQMMSHLLAGVACIARGIYITGSNRLAERGLKPIDMNADQLNVIRSAIAKPDCDPNLREALLAILAHNLEVEEKAAPVEPSVDSEWPEGGFVIGGE